MIYVRNAPFLKSLVSFDNCVSSTANSITKRLHTSVTPSCSTAAHLRHAELLSVPAPTDLPFLEFTREQLRTQPLVPAAPPGACLRCSHAVALGCCPLGSRWARGSSPTAHTFAVRHVCTALCGHVFLLGEYLA